MRFTLLELGLTAAVGGGIGFLSGVFGVGGAAMVVPILNIVLKVPMEFAVGSGACQILGPATTSLLARRLGLEHLRLPLTIAGGLFVGVLCGARLLESAKRHGTVSLAGQQRPLAELIVLGTYLLLLTGIGLFALWESRRTRQGKPIRRGWLAGLRLSPLADFPEYNTSAVSIPVLAWFGLGVGFLSGLLGMGGGLILLPGFIYLLGLKTHQSVMSSLVVVWIIALESTVVHASHGNVDLGVVMALLLGGTVGARLGSDLSRKLGGPRLRQSFGWLLLGTSAIIAARLLSLVLP